MAYISTEDVAVIRKNLKDRFPAKDGWKLSIRRLHGSTVSVSFLEAPINLDPLKHKNYNVNCFWIERLYGEYPELVETFSDTNKIIEAQKHCFDSNAGDMSADYANWNYFIDIEVGKWDRPFQVVKK